jgi:hypothetical protein
VFTPQKQRAGIARAVQIVEDRMQYLGRVAGIAALALGTTALSGCYAPPPVAEVTPDQVVAPYPPPAYPPVAEATPSPLTPGYATPGYTTPGYPSANYPPVAEAAPTPLTPGYTSPGYVTPSNPSGSYPSPVAEAAPTPLTPPSSTYTVPQYGSSGSVAMAPSNAGTTSLAAPYAPPPPRVEAPPPAPSPLAMWQAGHWSWNGVRYAWAPGHYVERPSANATWMPGRWQQGPAGWTWVDGYWAS